MSDLQPTFTVTAGAYRATAASPAGSPSRLVVDRAMDMACDALRMRLAERCGIELDDPVALSLGHDSAESPVFHGRVVALRRGVETVEVWALGGLRDLSALRVAAFFEGQSAGSIARDLAGRAGVATGTIAEGPVLPRYVADPHRNGHTHLQSIANRLGFELYADVHGRLMFHPPAGLSEEAYGYGEHLLDVAAVRRHPAVAGVTVSGESPMSTNGDSTAAWLTTHPDDYRGRAGNGDRLVVDPVARTKDLADRFASGVMAVSRRTASIVRATVTGRPALDLGSRVRISRHADGDVAGYVRALRHRFDGSTGFVTDACMTVNR
jgi:hypothetical protein